MAVRKLPRRWVFMDKKGRITIPLYMREALGIPRDSENYPLLVEAEPSLEDCKCLTVRK